MRLRDALIKFHILIIEYVCGRHLTTKDDDHVWIIQIKKRAHCR